MDNAIIAALHRARVFERAEPINPFNAPPDWQSALSTYRDCQPTRPLGQTIAVHPSTDASAILQRVLAEGDHKRLVERVRKQKWRARRSPEQVGRDRTRDREWRRIKRAGRRSAASM
jgi:hypothetical protein